MGGGGCSGGGRKGCTGEVGGCTGGIEPRLIVEGRKSTREIEVARRCAGGGPILRSISCKAALFLLFRVLTFSLHG